jgi:signal transduction histidine kinase/ActR/RegA family two-component response regulator
MTFPNRIARFLEDRFLASRRPFCMFVDGENRLVDRWGAAEHYGLEDLAVGQDVTSAAPFVADYSLREKVDLPFVTDSRGCAFHAHILPSDDGRYVVYLDARKELESARARQQASNEVKLLLERERRLVGELVDAQAELTLRRKEAEEESRRRGRYIGTMSHELKTPLLAMLAHAEQLAEADGSTRSPTAARSICRLVQQQLWLIDNLLTRVRLESERFTIHRSVTDTRALLDDLSLIFAPLAAERELSFALYADAAVPDFVLADDLHVRQVLVNLLGNAIKYTEQGAVGVTVRRDGEALAVEVSDTGVGIAAAEVAALFEPFRRGRDAPRTLGAGLGLGIARALVEAMDGELTIDSHLGRGTTVAVRIPAPTALAAATATESIACRGRILIAEDDPDLRDLLELTLVEDGYEVALVDDGLAAVDAAAAHRPDLIIVDMNMPRLDGAAAAQRLRETGFDGPILAVSAAGSWPDIDYALSCGCTEFIRKPVTTAALKRRVAKLLLEQRMRAHAPALDATRASQSKQL